MGTESLSDSLGRYLLAIHDLSVEHRVARSKDIAAIVGVSRPSVTGALQKLDKAGYINYEPYGYVSLTDLGRNEARKLLLKHRATQDFLEVCLGLPGDRATEVAADIEQHLPSDVLCRLVQFNNFYRQNPAKRYQWDPACRNLCELLYGMRGPVRCADQDVPANGHHSDGSPGDGVPGDGESTAPVFVPTQPVRQG